MKILLYLILNFVIFNYFYCSDRITIRAVGDIMLGSYYPYRCLPPDNGNVLFKYVIEYLTNYKVDLQIGNLEGAFTYRTNTKKKIDTGKQFAFNMPPEFTKFLKDANFDLVSIANNHAMDFGVNGLRDTISNLNKFGISYTGEKNTFYVKEIGEIKLVAIAFTWLDYANNYLKQDESIKFIRLFSTNSNNIVIVIIHGGAEGNEAMHIKDENEYFYGENRGNIVKFARKSVDNGADLVLCHGPHILRAIELYKGRLIAYSLGNFVTYRMSTSGNKKYTVILEVELNKIGEFLRGRIIPLMHYIEENYRGIPYYDKNKTSIKLLKYLSSEDIPDNKLYISDEGELLIK